MDSPDFQQVHDAAVIIDCASPLLRNRRYIDLYVEGGFTCVAPTVAVDQGAATTVKRLGEWLRFIDSQPNVLLVRRVDDILRVKQEGNFGIIFHFQGTDPLEDDLNLVEAYRALGVRIIQLTYNVKNRVGDGCDERTDSGLSEFGLALIERLNSNGIVIDCAHTGYRTTMEAMEASKRPVVFSHANARAVFDTIRNISDDQVRMLAKTGGVIGLNAVPYFVAQGRRPTLEQFMAHLDHFVRLVGVDHVALGLDYYDGQQPFATDEEADRRWREAVENGRWKAKTYPRPPHYYPEGLDTPAELRNLTRGLLARGYSVSDVQKILGGNWLRVFKEVWRA